MTPEDLDLFKEVLTGGVYDESAWMLVQGGEVPRGRVAAMRAWGKRAALRWLDRRGLLLVRRMPFDRNRRDRGEDWPLVGYTMTGRCRLDHLQRCIETVLTEGISGDVAETGVWRGGSCMLVKALFQRHGVNDRTIWLADSFRGLPPPRDRDDGDDLSGFEQLAVSAEQVRRNFARFGLLDENVRLLEGWFADTLPAAPIGRLAVLRLDGDLYSSTMDALQALYPRVSPGGFVIVDDYGLLESCRRAVHDYFDAHALNPELERIDGTGVAWRVPQAATEPH
ncbi:MAG TPA: TylF/MycF/NovP-related O-methyltransferase [Opitutus sp.]|nr:TylF/MycF/NovP-related O-methyltransferase [Opitutus sp.]